MHRFIPILLTLLITACTAVPFVPTVPPTPAPTPIPGLDEPIAAGLRFLAGQYNADYSLLQESPNIGQHRYYLTNDNALAAYVFEMAGNAEMADQLRQSLARYGYDSNGFVEVAWGKEIAWPPRHHKDIVVKQLTEGECDFLDTEETGPLADCVLQETHTDDLGHFYDWSSYSNLACMGAVNEYNAGRIEAARRLYEMKLADFDGQGFADAVFWVDRPGVYETLGLAWCAYASALLQAPVHPGILAALLAQQDPITGGFHTHYRADALQMADANVETTSVALLALLTLQNGPPQRGGLGFPGGPPPNP